MQDTRRAAATDAAKRIASSRRARRGLVAGYIHELSARHAAVVRPAQRPEPLPQPASAG